MVAMSDTRRQFAMRPMTKASRKAHTRVKREAARAERRQAKKNTAGTI
jgi:hypothetical protein